MVKHSFTFDGVDMRERFGLIVERFDDQLMPALRPRKLVIPGRDGAYDFGAQHYEEREITIACAAAALDRADCRELAARLSRKGRLIRWDEPDKYYVGRIYDAAALERIAGKAKRFELVFICEPFAYGRTVAGEMPDTFAYEGSATTPTRIEITNLGTTDILRLTMRIRERSDNY